MRWPKPSKRVRKIVVTVAGAVAAATVLWRLLPSEPLPAKRHPVGDRTLDKAPPDKTGPGV